MNEYEYTDMADAAVSVHSMLTQVRDSFNNSVNELKKMEEICLFLKNSLGPKTPPIEFDAGEELKMDKILLTDERFAMKLSNFLNKREPTERLELISKMITKLIVGIDELSMKISKMEERVRLMPQYIKGDDGENHINPEWKVSVNKLNQSKHTIAKLEKKLDFCYQKFFTQRKSVIGRILGICETTYANLERNHRSITSNFFENRYDISGFLDGIKMSDKRIRRTR